MGAGKEVLARAAAFELMSSACGGHGSMWTEQEKMHDGATTRAASKAAAEPLLRICATCPIQAKCRSWAIVDEYTGIAAGTAWSNGHPRPVDWVRRHPPHRAAS